MDKRNLDEKVLDRIINLDHRIDNLEKMQKKIPLLEKGHVGAYGAESVLHCPICDFDYVHIESVEDSKIKFWCENGHIFSIEFDTSKGWTTALWENENYYEKRRHI